MWVAAKPETVIEGINIINSPASKIFQAHILTRTGGIICRENNQDTKQTE